MPNPTFEDTEVSDYAESNPGFRRVYFGQLVFVLLVFVVLGIESASAFPGGAIPHTSRKDDAATTVDCNLHPAALSALVLDTERAALGRELHTVKSTFAWRPGR